MKTIRIQIPDKKIKFVMELMKQLGFKTSVEEDAVSEEQLGDDLLQGLTEVRETEEGNLPKRTLKDLLDEL